MPQNTFLGIFLALVFIDSRVIPYFVIMSGWKAAVSTLM